MPVLTLGVTLCLALSYRMLFRIFHNFFFCFTCIYNHNPFPRLYMILLTSLSMSEFTILIRFIFLDLLQVTCFPHTDYSIEISPTCSRFKGMRYFHSQIFSVKFPSVSTSVSNSPTRLLRNASLPVDDVL